MGGGGGVGGGWGGGVGGGEGRVGVKLTPLRPPEKTTNYSQKAQPY